MNDQEVIRTLSQIEGVFIVVGGAGMALRGLRPARDIDILVPWKVNGKYEVLLASPRVEAYDDIGMTYQQALPGAELIDGFLVIGVHDQISCKGKYLARLVKPKHYKDVRLLHQYARRTESGSLSPTEQRPRL